VVNNNNRAIGPWKDKMAKKSEYAKEFKAWQYKPVVTETPKALVANRRSQVSEGNDG